MIIAITYQERANILKSLSHVLLPSITLNLVAIAFKLVKRDRITIGIEVGVQNSGMAILIAVSFLDRPDYAIAAGVYGLAM